MSKMYGLHGGEAIAETFNESAAAPQHKKRRPPPFSIRFSDNERARLNRDAGALSWAAYIRLRLFSGDDRPPPRKRRTRRKYSPSAELAVLGKLLGAIGKSELAPSMRGIASAAKVGALPVTPELEQELFEACAAIQHMRRELISALGVKPQGGP